MSTWAERHRARLRRQRIGEILLAAAIVLVVGAFALAIIGAAHAQTMAEITACKPDAMRLCNPTIKDLFDHSRVAKCLHDNKSTLSEACRRVLTAHGM